MEKKKTLKYHQIPTLSVSLNDYMSKVFEKSKLHQNILMRERCLDLAMQKIGLLHGQLLQ